MMDIWGLLSFIVFLFILFMLGFSLGELNGYEKWKKKCIQRKVAEYNIETGEWQWKKEFKIKEK